MNTSWYSRGRQAAAAATYWSVQSYTFGYLQQIIENTLTPHEDLSFLEFYGYKAELRMNELARAYELQEEFTPVITTYWMRNKSILVTFTFSERNNFHDENF